MLEHHKKLYNIVALWKTMWKSLMKNLQVFHSGKLFPQKNY
mgnify:CR=1